MIQIDVEVTLKNFFKQWKKEIVDLNIILNGRKQFDRYSVIDKLTTCTWYRRQTHSQDMFLNQTMCYPSI